MTTTQIAVQGAKSSVRKWVLGALAAGVITTAAGAGTFASFSASTENPGNVFSTGQIELSNTKQGGTACLSGHTGTGTGAPASNLDANGNGGCDALIDLTLRSPGDTASGRLALANTGDYDGLLQFWLDGCTNTTVVTPAGSGNLCDKLEVFVQEFNSAYTTPTSSCVFPFNASAACNASWGASGDSLSDLATAATSAAPKPTSAITIAKDATRYYQVSLRFADGGFDANGNGVDNAFQNRRAAFDLTWRLQEA
jgi:hypothetical protein